jgi:hypothetical protein
LFLVGLIIELYVSGLGNPELKRHAQFAHPSPLDRTISIAVEFEAFERSKYLQYRKPRPDEAVTSVNAIKQSSNTEYMDLEISELAESAKIPMKVYKGKQLRREFQKQSAYAPTTKNDNACTN